MRKDFKGGLQLYIAASSPRAQRDGFHTAVANGLSLSLSKGCERRSRSGVRCGQHWRKVLCVVRLQLDTLQFRVCVDQQGLRLHGNRFNSRSSAFRRLLFLRRRWLCSAYNNLSTEVIRNCGTPQLPITQSVNLQNLCFTATVMYNSYERLRYAAIADLQQGSQLLQPDAK